MYLQEATYIRCRNADKKSIQWSYFFLEALVLPSNTAGSYGIRATQIWWQQSYRDTPGDFYLLFLCACQSRNGHTKNQWLCLYYKEQHQTLASEEMARSSSECWYIQYGADRSGNQESIYIWCFSFEELNSYFPYKQDNPIFWIFLNHFILSLYF